MKKPTQKATVVFLLNKEKRVCLARKKQAIHHQDGAIEYSLSMYNGYGGKMEISDATIYDTAIRELIDESNVSASKENLELVSRVYFYVKKEEEFIPFMEVSFFFLSIWQGTPVEGSEMGAPLFFPLDNIPYHQMMPADKQLLEQMFQGERKVYEVKLFGKSIPPIVRVLDEELV